MLVLGVLILTGTGASAQGGVAPAAPDQAAAEKATTGSGPSLEFRKFDDQGFLQARKGGAPVVLYFEADWCQPCKEMHAKSFREPAVVAAAAGMELFRVDMTNSDRRVDLIRESFEVIGAPTVIVFAPGGKEAARRFGFIPPEDLTEMLAKGRGAPETNGRPAPANGARAAPASS